MKYKIIFLILSIFMLNVFAFNDNNNSVKLTKEESAWLKDNPTITLGSDELWSPYIIKDANGNVSGYDNDILSLVNKRTGTNFKLIAEKWKDVLEKAKNKEIDGLSTSAVHKSREKFFNFSDIYISTNRLLVVSNTNPYKIKSIEDLVERRIGYQEKNLFDKKLISEYKNSIAVPLKSLDDVLEKLIKGEIDAVIGSHSLIYLANKKELPYIKVVNYLPNSSLNLVFSIRKDLPYALSILNKGLNTISEEELIQLKNKWFFNNSQTVPVLENEKKSFLSLTNEESNYLKEKKQIKMCVLPNWLPFEQIDENGNHIGIGNDIMKIVSKDINIPIVLVPTTQWSESLQNIKDRKCDILPVAMDTQSRRVSMNFTRPYTSEPFVIATKLDQLFIKDSKDIGNRKVGIVKSYAFIEVLKQKNPEIKIVQVSSAEEGLEKVRSGELFAYIDIMAAIGYNIQKHGLVDLKIAGKLEFDIKLSVASRNDEPLLASIMQKSIDKISKEQFHTIVKRWVEIKIEQDIDYKEIGYLVSFFVLVLLIVLYKNRSINLMNKELSLAHKEIIDQQKMVNKYVLILSTDLEGIITEVNEAYCKLLGFDRDELIGRTHNIMKHPSTSDQLILDMWEIIEADKTWIGQIVNYTKTKDIKYFNVYIEPLFQNGMKVGYRSISEDITDKHLSEELNQYQKSLLSLFDKGDAVLFKWKNNKKKDAEYISENIYRLTGYKNTEFTSGEINYSSLIHKDYSKNTLEEVNKSISNKSSYFKHEPYVIVTKQGREKWILDYTVTLTDAHGEITHFISYITDITKHILQQRMIFQQSRTSAVGEMIGNIAHQWRQPLSVISTAATGLKLSLELDDTIDKEEMSNTLSKINHHTQHLSRTIDDFRSFFKDDLTVVKYANLKDTIKKVRELTIDSFNINFIVYEEDIEDINHNYNENILIQALLNIYNNAKDVLSTKKYDRYFHVSIKKDNNDIILRFKDNGGGIDEDVMERIFEPYFTTKHESVGTGIGLYMTNQIITKQIHGSILVKNTEIKYKNENYKGVEFKITIPLDETI